MFKASVKLQSNFQIGDLDRLSIKYNIRTFSSLKTVWSYFGSWKTRMKSAMNNLDFGGTMSLEADVTDM